MLLGCWFMDFE